VILLLFPKTDMQLPALHVADSHDLIRVQAARACEQPQGRFVVKTSSAG
jgi:hypothetical protein